MDNSEKKVKPSVIVLTLVIICVIIIAVIGLLIYLFGMNNKLTQEISRLIPYPAASVNLRQFVTINELDKDLKSVRMFYENQDFSDIGMRVDFNTADGQKRLKIKEKNLLNKKIEDVIIKILAEKKGIKLNSEDVTQEVDRKINEFGNKEETLKNLMRLYGWDIETFKAKIVKPDMYKQLLEKSIKETNGDMVEARKKIDLAANALKEKEAFDEVAKKYSEGESAKDGGELGWLTSDQMIPEIAVAAFLYNKGEISDVIESPIGFHIINVEDKKTEDGVDMEKIRQIFVRQKNFADWLLEQEKSFNIYIPLKDYYWDNDSQSVQFKVQSLRDFESNLMKNSPDDISVIF